MRYLLVWIIPMLITYTIMFGLLEKPFMLSARYKKFLLKTKHMSLMLVISVFLILAFSVLLMGFKDIFKLNEFESNIAKGIILGIQTFFVYVVVITTNKGKTSE